MRVSLYARVTLKDTPRGFIGITGQSFTIGATEYVPLDTMITQTLACIAEYYGTFMMPDELNQQLDRIAEYCQRARFVRDTLQANDPPEEEARPDEGGN